MYFKVNKDQGISIVDKIDSLNNSNNSTSLCLGHGYVNQMLGANLSLLIENQDNLCFTYPGVFNPRPQWRVIPVFKRLCLTWKDLCFIRFNRRKIKYENFYHGLEPKEGIQILTSCLKSLRCISGIKYSTWLGRCFYSWVWLVSLLPEFGGLPFLSELDRPSAWV